MEFFTGWLTNWCLHISVTQQLLRAQIQFFQFDVASAWEVHTYGVDLPASSFVSHSFLITGFELFLIRTAVCWVEHSWQWSIMGAFLRNVQYCQQMSNGFLFDPSVLLWIVRHPSQVVPSHWYSIAQILANCPSHLNVPLEIGRMIIPICSNWYTRINKSLVGNGGHGKCWIYRKSGNFRVWKYLRAKFSCK